jgi:5'-nucleotidase
MTATETGLSILLTNDDGIQAPGLWALYRALTPHHRVTVVAPERERSAVGHGITLHKPLRACKTAVNGGFEGWAVTGTPADCIKLSMVELLDPLPDLVVSGINPGANVGVNMYYSGTVAAAKEAALYGVAAIAVSIVGDKPPLYYDDAARFIGRIVPEVMSRGLPRGIFLNVNIPNVKPDRIAGVRLGRQGCDLYDEYFEERRDPRNRRYYWQGYESQPTYTYSDADGALLDQNYIAITPVRCDMTDYDMLEKMRNWDLNGDS